MESAFKAAVRHIIAAIEPEILIEAFGKKETNPFMLLNIPLGTHIEREVIINQVVKDIQLFDNREIPISLEGLPIINVNNDYGTIFIPEYRRGGRDILAVEGISFSGGGGGGNFSGVNGSGQMSSGSNAVLSSLTRTLPDTEHDAELVAPNTILVNTRLYNTSSAMLMANLSVDDKLSHIKTATSLPFIELCVWKAKQLAYTNLNISIGRNMISKGKELGVFSDAVREYRDARQTYMELLHNFRVTTKLTDPIARKRHIKRMIPKLLG